MCTQFVDSLVDGVQACNDGVHHMASSVSSASPVGPDRNVIPEAEMRTASVPAPVKDFQVSPPKADPSVRVRVLPDLAPCGRTGELTFDVISKVTEWNGVPIANPVVKVSIGMIIFDVLIVIPLSPECVPTLEL